MTRIWDDTISKNRSQNTICLARFFNTCTWNFYLLRCEYPVQPNSPSQMFRFLYYLSMFILNTYSFKIFLFNQENITKTLNFIQNITLGSSKLLALVFHKKNDLHDTIRKLWYFVNLCCDWKRANRSGIWCMECWSYNMV